MSSRRLLTGVGLAVALVSLAACGGSDTMSASEETIQRQSDLYLIEQIEKSFHQAFSKHDIDLMMSLWAPNATFTTGPGQTLTGTQEIRSFWSKSKGFMPENQWVSETPAYKLRSTANGDKGTLFFECHFVDAQTGKIVGVTGADMEVARIDGHWLITSTVGTNTTLSP